MYDLVREEGNARLMIQQGADHAYTGMLDQPTSNVVNWVASLEGSGTRTAAAD